MVEQNPKGRKPFVVDDRIRRMIAGAVAEVDPAQIAALRSLTPAQRWRQAVAMIEAGERVAVYRLRHQRPELTESEALRAVRTRSFSIRAQLEEQWRKSQ